MQFRTLLLSEAAAFITPSSNPALYSREIKMLL